MTEQQTPYLWRRRNDSSDLTEPRVFVRVYVEPGGMDARVAFYEWLQNTTADMRFDYPEKQLKLAVVGAFLLIEGSEEALRPVRSTVGTLLVDDVRPYYDKLVGEGAEITFPLQQVPTGMGFNVRHPDGTEVEYVHHRPTERERGT